MKSLINKYVLLGTLAIGSIAVAQNYPYYGNSYPNDGHYSNESDWGYDEGFYDYAYNNFPDSYYYEYPVDYYPSDYYQSYYNDYRRSIVDMDWDRFFMEYNMSQSQIRQIMMLNQRFANYAAWTAFYGMNPDRWYYDRFYALERILGPRIFIVFQNRYYNGYSPIRYWQSHRRTYYIPRYQPVYRYRNVNSNSYYVGRDRYFQDYGSRYGWDNRRNTHNPGGLSGGTYDRGRLDTSGRTSGSGVMPQSNGGFRNGSGQSDSWSRNRAESRPSGTRQNEGSSNRSSGGFRSGSGTDARVVQPSVRTSESASTRSSWGFRTGGPDGSNKGTTPSARTSEGMRTGGFR